MKKETVELENHPNADEEKASSQSSVFDPYQAMLKCEEDEVQRRTESEDQEMFASICKQIRVSMKEILKLKTDKPEQYGSEVEEKKIKILMLMLSLRKVSRIQKVRVKDSREATVESRQGVDGATLQLQNLLYEVSHLKKEVRKCLEFLSADKEIDLVPIDQFYMEAPENISRPEETVEDPHQQRLAQLHWELEQRRGQTQLFDKLTQEKDKVANIISEQETKLASLAPRISAILEATLPLQKALNLPLEANREQQRISELLPSPLYTLWVQASSYSEACDALLCVEILGDAAAARKLITPEDDTKTEASDSENEMDGQEENIPRKSRTRNEKKSHEVDDTEDSSLKHLLSLHPLSVVLNIKMKDGNSVQIKFCYAQILHLVTTVCSLNLVNSTKPLLTDILNGDVFLNRLNPGDTGMTSPNPANEYQFQKLRLTGLNPERIKLIGTPYKWAQTLSGLSFLAKEIEQPGVDNAEASSKQDVNDDLDLDDTAEEELAVASSSLPPIPAPVKQVSETLSWKLSAEHMHHTVTAIKRRLQARLSLQSQFSSLEGATSTSGIPVTAEMVLQRFPSKVSSELRSWKPVAWSDYELSPSTEPLIACGAVDSDYLTFKAIFERQPVTLEALIAVSPDYPNSQPLFSLTLIWNKPLTAAKNPHIKQIESEVNVYWYELVSNRNERCHLLSLQLYRLAMCLDIFTEATSILLGQSSKEKEFHKEKIFFRPARGPDRALPLKYLPKLGVFAQR